MDELAGRYVTLGLRVARLHPRAVRAYTGPDRLVAAVTDEPERPPQTLANDADRLAADVAAEPTLPDDRADWLVQQLVALGTVARHLGGERLPFRQLARRVTGVAPDVPARSSFEKAHRRLDEVLPGTGPVAQRLRAAEDALLVPPDLVPAVLGEATAALRAPATRRYRLPPDAELAVVGGGSPPPDGRPAAHRYLGGHRGRLEVTTDRAVHALDVLDAAEGLGWPGAHAERVLREVLLVEEFGRGELTVVLASTPEAVVSAGIAAHARGIIRGDSDRLEAVAAILQRLGAAVPADEAQEIADARPPVADALALAALHRHADGWATADCAALLERTSLRPHGWCADAAVRLGDVWVAIGALAASTGSRLVAAHLAAQGDVPAAFRRLLTTQQTPSGLTRV